MYSIFNAISMDEFRRIATCTSAKEVWDILQVTHEGTDVVKVSKLQMLTFRFEIIRMEDHENFGEFHAKLMDIVNSSFNLGEPIPNSKVVRKILIYLLERFRAKVTAIEESKAVDSLKIDELIVPCASPWGSPDRGARHVSSWGIRMELLRIAMRAPCHQGKGSLHHAHADDPPCDVPSSPDIPHPEFCPGDVPPSPDISHPAPDAGWERRSFQLPRSDISGSSDSTYSESFAAILHSVVVFS
ncbi:hypothetical protein AAG906_019694 [Vitis piasezkii]